MMSFIKFALLMVLVVGLSYTLGYCDGYVAATPELECCTLEAIMGN